MDPVIERKARGFESASVKIERLTHRDLPEIHQIAATSFDKPWSERDFAFFLADRSSHCWGAFFEKRLVSYFIGVLAGGDLDTISVATLPEFRRKKVATFLLEWVLGFVEINRAFLEVDVENTSAMGLYQKLGFEVLHKRRGYYDGKKDAWLMRRTFGSTLEDGDPQRHSADKTEVAAVSNRCSGSLL